jgi:hypothetical protein
MDCKSLSLDKKHCSEVVSILHWLDVCIVDCEKYKKNAPKMNMKFKIDPIGAITTDNQGRMFLNGDEI